MKRYDITVNGKDYIGVNARQIQALQAKGYTVIVVDTYIVSDDDYNSIENKHALA